MIPGMVRYLSLLLIGILMGSGAANMVIGDQVDYLTMANKNLQDQLAEREYQLQKLNDAFRQKNTRVITTVEAYLSADSMEGLTEYDQLSLQLEANKKIKEWLSPLVGQDVNSIDGLLIPRIVDDRILQAEGNKYRIKTHLVIINEKISLYIKATILKKDSRE
ncbi:hypothetical protein DCCM_4706 [Desulfocucumis palustris]|uniref:Sporulation membrane protein YtrI C-terminal domain-containing protein n=1 Tax=Desulfocucumis palustris TaxID=1898651 RepID=A0A2L2XGU2_9FIRM|nr:hypothetical protein [Desulfocucumis palustris]GBF35577.1 hypothetical protein DCCM_4706 [Desulfocucumis palustris]